MSILMIGIDHSMAPVDVRARFSFTKKQAGEAVEKIKLMDGIRGCVLLSTCNRLELWASVENENVPLYHYLCQIKEVPEEEWASFFITRKDREAAEHLFFMTAGLKSQIMGEDQILTQVKEALSLAREHFASDGVMEVLFRMAVTSGKKIKTDISFSHGNASVIHMALKMLEKQGYTVSGKKVMVVGNGEMGRVSAQALMDAGADVRVTVRQYRSGIVDIPMGAGRLDYTDRMEYLPSCDLVVSATASPNYTLRREQFDEIRVPTGLVLIDLAVPRDIEPSIREIPGITFYDMDSFSTKKEEQNAVNESEAENLKAASVIVEDQLAEFFKWYSGQDVIPRVMTLKEDAVEDMDRRIQKVLKALPVEDSDKEKLKENLNAAAGKVVLKLIFGLRDSLSPDIFLSCVAGLEKLYEE